MSSRACCFVLAALVLSNAALAQNPAKKPVQTSPKTPMSDASVSVVLLAGEEGVGLRAQRWTQVFERLGLTLTIRRANFGEKPDVVETKLGKSRQIVATGLLEKDGRLRFPGQVFTEADGDKLEKWLGDLKSFGPQGSPQGQPLWGLSKTQFVAVFEALAKPVPADLREEPFEQALAAFAFPKEYPLAFSTIARKRVAERKGTVMQSFKGVSKGTALAALLADFNLGFHPQRRTDGKMELAIVGLDESKELWPVGWPLKHSAPETAPKVYSYERIDLEDIELDGVLDAASEFIGVPILVDSGGLRAKQIDVSKVKVSHPAKRTNWSLALKHLTAQAKARPELWLDEAGKPFLWITSITAPQRPGADAPIRAPGKNIP